MTVRPAVLFHRLTAPPTDGECLRRYGVMGSHGSLLPADSSIPPEGLAEHLLAPSPGQATVLVIDDNAVNRKILVTLMNYEGYRVVEASDGREGEEPEGCRSVPEAGAEGGHPAQAGERPDPLAGHLDA